MKTHIQRATLILVGTLALAVVTSPVSGQQLMPGEQNALMHLARQAGKRHFRPTSTPYKMLPELARLDASSNSVAVVIRLERELRGEGWGEGGRVSSNLFEAVNNALNDERHGDPLTRKQFDLARLELFLLGEGQRINETEPNVVRSRYVYGHDSLRITKGDVSQTLLNYMPMANGWSTPQFLDDLCKSAGLGGDVSEKAKAGTRARTVLSQKGVSLFRVPTVHLLESAPASALHLYRCSVFVPVASIDRQRVAQAVHDGGDWLLRSMYWNGAMEYIWRARSATTSSKNMQLRQWMATIALWDLYKFTNEEKYRDAARRNMAFNLKAGWQEEPDKGIAYINRGGITAFLGAAAFAMTAVQRIGTIDAYPREISMLRNFIFYSQREDGGLEPHYPKERKTLAQRQKSERYYSGEALLALLRLYEETREEKLLEAVQRAFPYQVKFFARDQHPAAVPWLTQAYYRAWLVEKKQEYVDFIFNMSDFLLKMQNVTGKPTPDLLGEFYDPDHPEYGPSNVASTGVYVEGLVDSYRLAKAVGDKPRMESYRRAIILGIRNLIHLQFKDDNLFYLPQPDRTRGGMRGNASSHAIRIDYVQHAVQGMIQALEALDSWTLNPASVPQRND